MRASLNIARTFRAGPVGDREEVVRPVPVPADPTVVEPVRVRPGMPVHIGDRVIAPEGSGDGVRVGLDAVDGAPDAADHGAVGELGSEAGDDLERRPDIERVAPSDVRAEGLDQPVVIADPEAELAAQRIGKPGEMLPR